MTAQAVSFTDSNPLVGTVSGIIDITRASNENGIASALGVSNGCPKKNSTVKPMKFKVSYNLYFAANGVGLELIVKLPVTSSSLEPCQIGKNEYYNIGRS